jgi:hypothetical protein
MIISRKWFRVHDNIGCEAIDPKVYILNEIKICDSVCMKKGVWGPNFQEKTKTKYATIS